MRIDSFNIFQNESCRGILCNYIESRQFLDEKFSVRKWSKELGHNSHSLLSLQLQGKRKIKTQHVDSLSFSMGLTESEKQYFKALTILEKSTSEEEKIHNLGHLLKVIPKKHLKTKKYIQFELLSNWRYMAILSLSEVDGFSIREETIKEKLGHKLTPSEIIEALSLLTKEGLLEKREQCYFPVYQAVTTDNKIRNKGIREYHKGACDLAKESIEELDIDNREFQSFCLSIPKDKMNVAKDLIRKFRDEFYQTVGGSGEDIYKMNIQLFQLSRSTDSLKESEPVAREFAPRMQ